MQFTINNIISEYFVYRQDGGVKFDIKNRSDFLDFEEFIFKNKYNNLIENSMLKQLFEQSVDIDGTKDYVKAVWKNFMGTNISDEELQSLTDSVITFKTQYPNQTLSDAFLFLKSNPKLLSFQKKEVGEGEFAILLLVKGSRKIPKGKKGDVLVNGISYEIKKIKSHKEAIRFGTNLNLRTINQFNTLILRLSELLNSDKYKEGETIITFKKNLASIISYKDRGQSSDLEEGSKASWTVKKIQKLYEFLKVLRDYTAQQRIEKSITTSTSLGKNFVFKVNDVDKDLYFKLPFDDIKKSLKSGKVNTHVEPTTDKQDTEEIVSFSEELSNILNNFLKEYPTAEDFGKQVVVEINNIYNSSNLKLIIIDELNNFLLNPEFNFFSINQYFRPQVTLAK